MVTRPTLLPSVNPSLVFRDPQGHLWWLHQRIEDVPPDELASRFSEPAALEAMAYVQRSLREELSAANQEPD